MFDNITAETAQLYAIHEYDNPQCLSYEEWAEDYKQFKYVKRMCRRYLSTGHMSERLMLNHLILLMNVFGTSATVRLLFLKCHDKSSRSILKTFLAYLNVLPELVCGIDGEDINMKLVAFDPHLWNLLHTL